MQTSPDQACVLGRSKYIDLGAQAAVFSNTQALVQRNITAGAMRVSQQPTAAAVVFSPCGQLIAWLERAKDRATLNIEKRSTKQEVFSQILPRPSKRCAAKERADNGCTICWSHDSSWLTLTCARGVFAANLVWGHQQAVLSSALSLWELQLGATCQQSSTHPSPKWVSAQSLLSLYDTSGSEPHMVQQVTWRHIQRLVWADNSQVLAVQGFNDLCIFTIGRQDQVPVPGSEQGRSTVAWSPPSLDEPCLLCLASSGEATFIDCEAALKGRREALVEGEDGMARHVVWGEHGVVVITFHDTLWLFDVHRGSTGLVLESRQHMSMPLARSLVLSPDQVHLCMVQCAQIARGKFSRSLVILNVISGSQALIPLPEHLTSDDHRIS